MKREWTFRSGEYQQYVRTRPIFLKHVSPNPALARTILYRKNKKFADPEIFSIQPPFS
jgi:hypothetical protein